MGRSFWTDALYRPGRNTQLDIRLDYVWLLGLALLTIATGIGFRDPWPADEPRFALIARDMLASGDWLVPRVGGDIYADKPPLFFWMIALALKATGSLRLAFLLPSVLSSLGCLLLIYDLSRRLWNRETGLVAGLLLLSTVQFVWQARQAQIDATLCFWTTLSLYGLLRHLLLGPTWRWYGIGWAAAGLGVITKGVGFLPLLIFLPFALLRSDKWSPRSSGGGASKWFFGPLAFLLAVSAWLVPILVAARTDPAIAVYRDEILFRQTITRYADAWHHREPFWYFLVQVIPLMWLPLTALLPWLLPKWRAAWHLGDLRIALPLSWVVLVVLFFSFSSGKRGVYVLPAVPALVLASAPYVAELASRRAVQRTLFAIAASLSVVSASSVAPLLMRPEEHEKLVATYNFDPLGVLMLFAVVAGLLCILLRPRRGIVAYCAVLTTVLLVVSFGINPAMNASRSGATFAEKIEQVANPSAELGLVAFKAQYILNLHRPIVHFGHARWRERYQEAADAARWLSEDPSSRQLVVGEYARVACFEHAETKPLGAANRTQWYLVRGATNPDCIASGNPATAIHYAPKNHAR